MSLLAEKLYTVGDIRQYIVDYKDWLRRGDWLTHAIVTVSPAPAAVSGVTIVERSKVSFFVSGGVLNEYFTVTIVVTDSNTEVSNDTIKFHVVTP